MMQNIDGKHVYVVEFDTMPELPITGLTHEETVYENVLDRVTGGNRNGLLCGPRRTTGTYAKILQSAIEEGIITEPGKYGLHIVPESCRHERRWEVFIVE